MSPDPPPSSPPRGTFPARPSSHPGLENHRRRAPPAFSHTCLNWLARPCSPYTFSNTSSDSTPSILVHHRRFSDSHYAPKNEQSSPLIPSNEQLEVLAPDVQHALTLAQIRSELAPMPCIGPLMESLTQIFKVVECARINKEQWKLLKDQCVMAIRVAGARVTKDGQLLYPEAQNVTTVLSATLERIVGRAQYYSNMSKTKALTQFRAMSDEIQVLFSELDSCLGLFSYTTDITQGRWLSEFLAVRGQELLQLEHVHDLLSLMCVDLRDSPTEKVPMETVDAREKRSPSLSSEKDNQLQEDGNDLETLRSEGMSALEMFDCLIGHGCLDLTKVVDSSATSQFAVASGGYGDIWKGRLYDNKEIAIKAWRLHRVSEDKAKSLKKAMRELYNWSKADHENIHKLLGVVLFHDRLGMVSKWMENGNLRYYLKRNETIDRYPLCVQATKAIRYLHNENMVHGDIKACNFLVSSDGIVKLTDFDHSIVSDRSLVFSETTERGGGTLRWMAPELVLKLEHRSKPADVYALGMTLLEIITDGLPYYPQCQEDYHVYWALSNKMLPERVFQFKDEKGAQMWELLTYCWDHNPTRRPTADEVLVAQVLIAGTTDSATGYANVHDPGQAMMEATGVQLPPTLRLAEQSKLDSNIPIRVGTTCDIYTANSLGGEKVAKKILRMRVGDRDVVRQQTECFVKAAYLWGEFRSSYTLPFYGIGVESLENDPGRHLRLYVVSPLMKNYDAVTYLKRHRNDPGMKLGILRIITDAALGLEYLHNRNPPVVHAGMRGDNILITDSGGAVLGGLGLTEALGSDGTSRFLPAAMAGKAESQRWIAPEIFLENDIQLRTSSDVWGWAMAALEESAYGLSAPLELTRFPQIVSGSMPYHTQEQALIVMLKVYQESPKRKDHPDFEGCAHRPDEMWELFARCWAAEPNERPTMSYVVKRLKEIAKMPEYVKVSD